MKDNKDIDKLSDNLEYTLVLDGSYLSTYESTQENDKAADDHSDASKDIKERMDRLYYDYERMSLSEPTILDKDDAYPHSYQWRLGDKYDPGKLPVLEEAVRARKKITDTEAYAKYIDEVRNHRFTPDSWE